MRRAIVLVIVVLELAAAVLLVVIGAKLPSNASVEKSFRRAENMASEAGKQVALLRDSQDQVLGSAARGMESWANALDPAMIRQLRQGTAQLAAFIQEDIAPAAARSADRLEKAIALLQKDAVVLGTLLKEAPPDLKAAKEIHDSLARFGEGLDRLSLLVSPERLKTMREGFKGMEDSLDTGAEQVDRLSGFTYPVVKFNGLKPDITEKSFWPDGEDIAKGMRKGAKALREAGKEIDSQAENLPQVQRSLDASRLAVAAMRGTLGKALKNQEQLEAVLKSLPAQSAKLAEEMPLLSKDLTRVLRETERLSDVAKGLTQAQQLLGKAEESWPAARQGLLDAAARLDALRTADANSDEAKQHKRSLEKLGGNLEELSEAIPPASRSAVEIVTLARWLLWVLAAALALHALIGVQARAARSLEANR